MSGMSSYPFPGCCGGTVLRNVTMYSEEFIKAKNKASQGPYNAYNKAKLDSLKAACKDLISGNQAFIVLTVNDNQKTSDKALRGFGFKHTEWMDRPSPQNKIRLFYITVKDIKRLGWDK